MRSHALTLVGALFLVVMACTDSTAPTGGGVLEIATLTTGVDVDTNGYLVAIDGNPGQHVPMNGTATFTGLGAGSHAVLLTGNAANCRIGGDNPRAASVEAGGNTHVTFTITCVALANLDIAGTWDWTEQFTNRVCYDTGTYVFSQSGSSFSGTSEQVGSCPVNAYVIERNDHRDPVGGGTVSVDSIAFLVGLGQTCQYRGAVIGSPPDHLRGTAVCGNSTGTWDAVRGAPAESVTVAAPAGTFLEGSSVQLVAKVWSSAGARVFRPVVWSSDRPAVVAVSADGSVTAVAAGSATITATAEGRSGGTMIVVVQKGHLRVTTATTGVDPDPDGYTVRITTPFWWESPIADAGSITNSWIPGDWSVQLVDAAANCVVVGPNPRTIAVSPGDTATTHFDVVCAPVSRLAFTSTRDGNANIYAINNNGTNLVQLTTLVGFDGEAAWSPDGSTIAFRSNRDGNDELYRMNIDGSAVTRLTDDAAFDGQPAWSPDGTRIAFTSQRDGNSEIYLMNADGSGLLRLTNSPTGDENPAWSPDGSKLAFQSARDGNYEIYIMNADGSGVARLTNDPALDAEPAWSPDGTRISFRSNRDGIAQIYVLNVDGSGLTRLTNDYGDDLQPTWSPDGSSIAFTKIEQGCDDYNDCWEITSIYIMHADGSALIPLRGTDTGLDSDPAWLHQRP